MKIFIGMETSGVARRGFAEHGHEVISCDILPSEDDCRTSIASLAPGVGIHVVGDVFATLASLYRVGWWPDLALFHPACTFLTNSAEWAYGDGPYHQDVKPGTLVGAARSEARELAIEDFMRIVRLPIRRKAIENPIGVMSARYRKPDQILQPNRYGDDASKATCLWLFNLSPLVETRLVKPRLACGACLSSEGYGPDCRCLSCGASPRSFMPRWSNQTNSGQNRVSPGEDRWKDRARSYPGVIAAMVDQWSDDMPADLFTTV